MNRDPLAAVNRALAASPRVCLICHEIRPGYAKPGVAVCTCGDEVEKIARQVHEAMRADGLIQ